MDDFVKYENICLLLNTFTYTSLHENISGENNFCMDTTQRREDICDTNEVLHCIIIYNPSRISIVLACMKIHIIMSA